MPFKELKSKKTGRVSLITQEEYAQIVNNKPELLNRFIVTDITSRPIVPPTPTEIKVTKPIKKSK